MKKLILDLRIWRLKRLACRHYQNYIEARSGDGGHHITRVISGHRIDRHARRFNDTMARWRRLDKTAPEVWL